MSKLDKTRDQINDILNFVDPVQLVNEARLTMAENKANQNETDIAANQTDIAANEAKLTTLSGQATAIDHNTDGALAPDLGTARQHPVNMSAHVTQFNLSNGTPGQSYMVNISIDNAVRTFAFAPDLDEGDTAGIYNAGDVVTHPNGRVYKAATGQSGLQGAQFQTGLDTGNWELHIRTNNDDGYLPSQDDEDLLAIECIGTDYYKVTPHYGS